MTGPELWKRGPRKGVGWHLVWCLGLTLWSLAWLTGCPLQLLLDLPRSVGVAVVLWLMGWAGFSLSFWAWTLIAVALGVVHQIGASSDEP